MILSVHAHEESVLGLYLSEDGNYLFSSGGDSVVNVSLSSSRNVRDRTDIPDRYGLRELLNACTPSIPIMTWATSSPWCTLQATKPFTAVRRTLVSRYDDFLLLFFIISNFIGSGATCQRKVH